MRPSISLLAATGLLVGLLGTASTVARGAPGIGGLASDQPCAPTVAVDQLVPLDVAVQELEPMVLTRAELGTAGDEWSPDVWLGRYNDDAELAQLGLFGDAATCERLAEFGRVTGYSGSWETWDDDAVARRASSVHLFLDEEGAAAFLAWLPQQLTGPPPGDAGLGGTDSLDEVEAAPIPTLGPGAGSTLIGHPGGNEAWAWFRLGSMVGTVTLVEPEASVTEAVGLAADLAARMAAARRTARPWDATAVLSAGLPLAELGSAYAGFEWAWFFGGCWDAAESAEQSSDPDMLAERYARTGFLVRCAAMYEPPPMTEVVAADASPQPGIVRIASLISPFETAEGAATAWAEGLADAEDAAGAEFERFDVPGVEGAIGTRRPVADGIQYTDTRVAFLHGPAIVTIFIHDQAPTDHRDELVDLAAKLAARVDRVLPLPVAVE